MVGMTKFYKFQKRLIQTQIKSIKESSKDKHIAPLIIQSHEKLPQVCWKPEIEFQQSSTKHRSMLQRLFTIPYKLSQRKQIIQRISKITMNSVLRPVPITLFCSLSLYVFGMGIHESLLYMNPLWEPTNGYESYHFMLRYAFENFVSSCLWETREAEIIVNALHLDPKVVLIDYENDPELANTYLKLLRIQTRRSIVGGFMIISQVLGIISAGVRAIDTYSTRVFNGIERPLHGIQERVIRLSGSNANVLEVSLSNHGEHILPIIEKPDKLQSFMQKWSHHGKVPFCWKIEPATYGHLRSFKDLTVDASYLIKTSTQKSILLLEADGTTPENSLNLSSNLSNGLHLLEASQAFRILIRQAKQSIHQPFRPLRVYLGSLMETTSTDDHHRNPFYLHNRRIERNETDLFIDANACILYEILQWAYKQKERKICIDVHLDYYPILKGILEYQGFQVYTQNEAEMMYMKELEEYSYQLIEYQAEQQLREKQLQKNTETNLRMEERVVVTPGSNPSRTTLESLRLENKVKVKKIESKPIIPLRPKPQLPLPMPHFFYHSKTSITINTVLGLLAIGKVKSSNCCVLIDKIYGMYHFENLLKSPLHGFTVISSPMIYDQTFRQIRTWIRLGYSKEKIQEFYNEKFKTVLKLRDEIKLYEEQKKRQQIK